MMLKSGLNAPLTSSVGRLFDAVASLVDLRQASRFEGEAAMALEFACEGIETEERYPFMIADCGSRIEENNAFDPHSTLHTSHSPLIIDWSPMIESILSDLERRRPPGEMAARFHNTLAETIVSVARRIGEERVVLTGGCFQNKTLTESAVTRLRAEGFRPYWHQQIPPNDGGLAVGQILAVLRTNQEK
jgi:hydrogenase maturation protein HypF